MNGHGLTFNVGQRVQAFTHPLWAGFHIPVYAAWRDIYAVGLLLSMLTSLFAALLSWKFFAKNIPTLAFLLLGMIGSAAFMDFSTSGLENPLTHLLLVVFCGLFFKPQLRHQLFWLSLLAGLLLLNRMDTVLLVAPALLLSWWPQRSWRTFGIVMAGLGIFILWEVFATFYYGFPFPMTAYAKLNTGIVLTERILQGYWYFQECFLADPLSLLMILTAIILPWLRNERKYQSLSMGLGMYMLYILYIGGDFMLGRFFCSPFLLALIIVIQVLQDKLKLYSLPIIALLSIIYPGSPLRSHADFGIDRSQKLETIGSHGISNERAFYFQGTGLIAAKGRKMPDMDFVDAGKTLSTYKKGIYLTSNMGITPFYAGSGIYFIDRMALTDPFLAQLPALYHPSKIPGHHLRLVPSGYIESLEQQKNLLENEALQKLYAAIETITRGPLWQAGRLQAIWDINSTRKYTRKLDKSFFKLPVTRTLSPEEVRDFDFPITLYEDKGVELQLPWDRQVKVMKLSVDSPCDFVFVLRYGKEIIGGETTGKNPTGGEFLPVELDLPDVPKSNMVIYPLKLKQGCRINMIAFE